MIWLSAIPGLIRQIPWQAVALVLVAVGSYFHGRAKYTEGVDTERAAWESKVADAEQKALLQELADKTAIEEQNSADRLQIAELQARLDSLVDNPPPIPDRIVRVCRTATATVSAGEGDAGSAAEGEASGSSVRAPEDSWGSLRADLLKFAGRCQLDLTAALAGKEQWPQ